MLVPSMRPGEITNEILRDFARLDRSTLPRLCQEYERERKKLNIDKTRTYTKVYPIKTAAKNNWLFFLRKKLAAEKFRGIETLAIVPVVYYYADTGLRVFNYTKPELIGVYNAHLFTRYNERMRLNLHLMTDVVKHFFFHNGQVAYRLVERKNERYIIGFCSNGFTLGRFENNDSWLVHRTFVSNDMIKPGQSAVANELLFQYQLLVTMSDVGFVPIDTTVAGILRDKIKARQDFNPY